MTAPTFGAPEPVERAQAELTFSPWMSARSYDELHPPRSRQSITEADLFVGYGAITAQAVAS